MYGLNRLICRENGMGKILKTIDLLVVVLILQHITVLINLIDPLDVFVEITK